MGMDLVYSAQALRKQHAAHPLTALFKNGAAMVTVWLTTVTCIVYQTQYYLLLYDGEII